MSNTDFYKDKRILLTGHTGFKGTWLSLMLEYLGADTLLYAFENIDKTPFFEMTSTHIL